MSSTSFSLTHHQDQAIKGAARTENALLRAQEHLYAALRRPQPGRERRWAETVGRELGAALGALRDHRLEVEGDDGLYSELQRDAPWTASRVRQVSAQLQRIEGEAVDLQIEVARVESGDLYPVQTIRGEAERLLLSLRDVLNKESDLVFERFNEPAALD